MRIGRRKDFNGQNGNSVNQPCVGRVCRCRLGRDIGHVNTDRRIRIAGEAGNPPHPTRPRRARLRLPFVPSLQEAGNAMASVRLCRRFRTACLRPFLQLPGNELAASIPSSGDAAKSSSVVIKRGSVARVMTASCAKNRIVPAPTAYNYRTSRFFPGRDPIIILTDFPFLICSATRLRLEHGGLDCVSSPYRSLIDNITERSLPRARCAT